MFLLHVLLDFLFLTSTDSLDMDFFIHARYVIFCSKVRQHRVSPAIATLLFEFTALLVIYKFLNYKLFVYLLIQLPLYIHLY